MITVGSAWPRPISAVNHSPMASPQPPPPPRYAHASLLSRRRVSVRHRQIQLRANREAVSAPKRET